MKITPRVLVEIPIPDIGYKYNSRKVLGFIATDGARSTEPGDTYLCHIPDIYSNAYVRPVVCPHFLGSYFNACSAIDNKIGCGSLI